MSRLTKQEKQIVMNLLQEEADYIQELGMVPGCNCMDCAPELKKINELRNIIAKLKTTQSQA